MPAAATNVNAHPSRVRPYATPEEVDGHTQQNAAEREPRGARVLAQRVAKDHERGEDKEEGDGWIAPHPHGAWQVGAATSQNEHGGGGEGVEREDRHHELVR